MFQYRVTNQSQTLVHGSVQSLEEQIIIRDIVSSQCLDERPGILKLVRHGDDCKVVVGGIGWSERWRIVVARNEVVRKCQVE